MYAITWSPDVTVNCVVIKEATKDSKQKGYALHKNLFRDEFVISVPVSKNIRESHLLALISREVTYKAQRSG